MEKELERSRKFTKGEMRSVFSPADILRILSELRNVKTRRFLEGLEFQIKLSNLTELTCYVILRNLIEPQLKSMKRYDISLELNTKNKNTVIGFTTNMLKINGQPHCIYNAWAFLACVQSLL